MARREPGSRLDGVGARLTAAGLCLAAAGFLVWYERDRLFPPDPAAAPANPAAAAYLECRAERYADIDGMKADGVITQAQETLFRQRADALCRSRHPVGGD